MRFPDVPAGQRLEGGAAAAGGLSPQFCMDPSTFLLVKDSKRSFMYGLG
jgi:hypothetical protein